MAAKCKRVHSHVYSTVLNGSNNWPWSGAMINKVRTWEAQILRLTFRPRMRPDETWVTYKLRTSRFMRISWKKMGLPLLTEKIVGNFWTTMTWAVYDGDVPKMLALLSFLEWRTTAWWRDRASWRMAWAPPTTYRGGSPKFGFTDRGVLTHRWRSGPARRRIGSSL